MTGSIPKKGAQPRLDIDRTRDWLHRLGLDRAAELLDGRLALAAASEDPPHRLLDELLREELESREERRIRTSLRLSGLPTGMTLEDFDFGFQPGIERSRIETLGTCTWIREQESVLLQGPPGVGKTHLATALGVRAIQAGFSVAFYRFEELLSALRRDAESAPSQLRRRKYVNAALLIIDEMGFEPMDRLAASLVFRLVSYRYGRGSVLITTNKGVTARALPGSSARITLGSRGARERVGVRCVTRRAGVGNSCLGLCPRPRDFQGMADIALPSRVG